MKLALGMMVKDFVSDQVLMEFLDNAERYGHTIDLVIVAFSHQFSEESARRVQERTEVSFVKLNYNEHAQDAFRKLNMPEMASCELLHCQILEECGLVPYGFNRNTVLIESLLSDVDILFFIDSDVHPYVLRFDEDSGSVMREEIDFFGSHLAQLRTGADITTSDYSGYSILPPAQFPHMEDLLYGLHKESMTSFWTESEDHHCLILQHTGLSQVRPTAKILGGNMALRMEAMVNLPPFFSPYYFCEGVPYAARGEDTLLGLLAHQGGAKCTDIDTLIFHDTYGTYPVIPDLKHDPTVQSRLFYACTGWIGRNIFFCWKTGEQSVLEEATRVSHLSDGAKALAEYTQNDRFLQLPGITRAALNSLPDMIRQYQAATAAWDAFIERWSAA